MKLTKQERLWLRSALAVKPGSKHPDLGRYRKQDFGVACAQPCERCGKFATRKGHDPCLAGLPGVVNACCGHGMMFAYATLSNGFCLRGKALKIYLQKVGRLKQFQKLAKTDLP